MPDEDRLPRELDLARLLARFEFFALNAGIPPQDCPDVAQEAAQSIIQQIKSGRFRSESTFETWAIAILKNKTADYWRRLGRQRSALGREQLSIEEGLQRIGAPQELTSIVRQALERPAATA